VVRPEIVERAVELAIDTLRPDRDKLNQRRAALLTEIRRLDKELSHLTSAVASGGDLPVLLAALKERQTFRQRGERALLELDATDRIGQRELSRLEREVRHRLADWRTMLRREVPQAREILRNLIAGRIVFTPRPEALVYEFSGRGSLARLLAGTARPVSLVTPAGRRPSCTRCRTCRCCGHSASTGATRRRKHPPRIGRVGVSRGSGPRTARSSPERPPGRRPSCRRSPARRSP
jgi:hypothetical protein